MTNKEWLDSSDIVDMCMMFVNASHIYIPVKACYVAYHVWYQMMAHQFLIVWTLCVSCAYFASQIFAWLLNFQHITLAHSLHHTPTWPPASLLTTSIPSMLFAILTHDKWTHTNITSHFLVTLCHRTVASSPTCSSLTIRIWILIWPKCLLAMQLTLEPNQKQCNGPHCPHAHFNSPCWKLLSRQTMWRQQSSSNTRTALKYLAHWRSLMLIWFLVWITRSTICVSHPNHLAFQWSFLLTTLCQVSTGSFAWNWTGHWNHSKWKYVMHVFFLYVDFQD